jgi:putative transposase
MRPPSRRRQHDLVLADRIEVLHRQSRSTYGRPRLRQDLRDEGFRVSDKRIARIMRERKIHGATRRKGCKTTVRDRDARPAPDPVDRNFTASGPDQLWGSDITYIPTWERLLVSGCRA